MNDTSGSTVVFLTLWYACAAMTATSGVLEYSMRQNSQYTKDLAAVNMSAAAIMAVLPITESLWTLRDGHGNGRVVVYGIFYIAVILLQCIDGPENLARAGKEKDAEVRRKRRIAGILGTSCIPLMLAMPLVLSGTYKRRRLTRVVPDKHGQRYLVVPQTPVVPRRSPRVAADTALTPPIAERYSSYRSPSAARSNVVPWNDIKEQYKNF